MGLRILVAVFTSSYSCVALCIGRCNVNAIERSHAASGLDSARRKVQERAEQVAGAHDACVWCVCARVCEVMMKTTSNQKG